MLDYYQNFIEKLKKKKQKVQMSLKFVQNVFEMEDMHKELKLNATTEEQVQRVEKLEKQTEELKEKICIPQENYKGGLNGRKVETCIRL